MKEVCCTPAMQPYGDEDDVAEDAGKISSRFWMSDFELNVMCQSLGSSQVFQNVDHSCLID